MPEIPDDDNQPVKDDGRLREVRKEIGKLKEQVEGASVDMPTLQLLQSQQLRDVMTQLLNLRSELVRIRAALEDKDIDRAIEEANERETGNADLANHAYLKKVIDLADFPTEEEDERESENSKNEESGGRG